MSTAIGEIIHVTGRPERVTERVPIHNAETGKLLYYALKAEPVDREPEQGPNPAP